MTSRGAASKGDCRSQRASRGPNSPSNSWDSGAGAIQLLSRICADGSRARRCRRCQSEQKCLGDTYIARAINTGSAITRPCIICKRAGVACGLDLRFSCPRLPLRSARSSGQRFCRSALQSSRAAAGGSPVREIDSVHAGRRRRGRCPALRRPH